MEINAAASIASQEISVNKAQTGLDVLTRTVAKTEQAEQTKEPQSESVRMDIAQQTGKGQNIDIKA
jgi:hypothetical protein